MISHHQFAMETRDIYADKVGKYLERLRKKCCEFRTMYPPSQAEHPHIHYHDADADYLDIDRRVYIYVLEQLFTDIEILTNNANYEGVHQHIRFARINVCVMKMFQEEKNSELLNRMMNDYRKLHYWGAKLIGV